MQTTLYNGDRLIVVKYQRTWARITGHPYIPNIGDIIVFNENGIYNSEGVQEKQLIKRVVALPGDRVVISNGTLKVYDKAHPNGSSPDQTLPYGKVVGYTKGNLNLVLPKNYIFVCGDNRPDSYDSRDFGPINVNQIVGKLDLRIYPFGKISAF
jgi:signal peptidase I